MFDHQEHLRVIASWRQREQREVLKALKELQSGKCMPKDTLSHISLFHKDITKETAIPIEWFNCCKAIKKKLKSEAPPKDPPPKAQAVQITYPPLLTENHSENIARKLKCLYRHFMSGMGDVDASEVCVFLIKLLKEVRIMFEDRTELEENKRIDSICLHFEREGSKGAKSKMIRGDIGVKTVAIDDQDVYVDEETRKWVEQIERENFQASQMGFYDVMKKEINMNAQEECRHCQSKSAYCEDQKQTRAADQPMTRFMRCNSCGKGWRD